jgi:hypothetical protein
MEKMTEAGLAILAAVGFMGWLGGGRKWAFRSMLSVFILAGLGLAGMLLYGAWTDRVAERRASKIHDCAVAKIAQAKCLPGQRRPEGPNSLSGPWEDYQKPEDRRFLWSDERSTPKDAKKNRDAQKEVTWEVCPPYMLLDNPTPEQENSVLASAEDECAGEIDAKRKSLHDQIDEYKRQHAIK